MSRRVHFLGNAHVSRTACGRLVGSWLHNPTRPDTTDKREHVTCRACIKAIA